MIRGAFRELSNIVSNVIGIEERDLIHGQSSLVSNFITGQNTVTEKQAMKIPAVATSVDLITSSIARLPIKMYRTGLDDEVIEIKSDKRLTLLNKEPNSSVNSYNFKKRIAKDYLFHGRSFIIPTKVRNNYLSMYHIPQENVRVKRYLREGYIPSAKIQIMDKDYEKVVNEFHQRELITILKDSSDGITGSGILKDNQDVLSMALNEIEYSSNLLENGALPIGMLSTASRLTDDAIKRLRESWNNLYAGSSNSGKTIILEEGLEYRPVSLNPNEMDLTSSKKTTVSDIARIFNIPESMINSNANKYASNEQNNIHFLQYCIAPAIVAIEAGLNKALLLETEKDSNFYFKFDTSEILRTTEKEKIEAVSEGFNKGLYTMNEARTKLDMKNIESEDYFLRGLGDIFVDAKSGLITVPNLGRVINPQQETKFTEKELEELEAVAEEMKKKEAEDVVLDFNERSKELKNKIEELR